MMRKIAAVWIAAQVAFLGGWAVHEQSRFGENQGESILVRVRPVDPRDLLRGQYLSLAYDFNWPDQIPGGLGKVDSGTTVWVALLRGEGGFYAPAAIGLTPPEGLGPGAVMMRGRVDGGRVLYGIEEYYVPEGTPTPEPRDITVRLRVDDSGTARIEQVYVKGAAWP